MEHNTSIPAYPPAAPVPSLSITGKISGPVIITVTVLTIFQFLAVVAIILRIYARIVKGGRFYLNDYAIFWAFLWSSSITCALLALAVQGTLGQHITVIAELATASEEFDI